MALARLATEDPMLRAGSDSESGRIIVYGVGEIHLRLVCERLKGEFGVAADFGPFKVVYRETIRKEVREEAKFVREFRGRRQFAQCILNIEPMPVQEGFEFICAMEGMPPRFVAQIEKGVREGLENSGPIGLYPIVGIKATLVGGSFREDESDEMSFKIAGAMALRSGCMKASPAILEPIMKCEIVCLEKYLGNVVKDMNGRRAKFIDMSEGPIKTLNWTVPLSETFGLDHYLRGMSAGTGSIMMEPSHFEEIPIERWKASIDPHSPDEPPTAGAGRPVKPIKPKPGLSGGRGKPFPPKDE